jgi:hypothetical protein
MSLPYLTVNHPKLSHQQNANHVYIKWNVNTDNIQVYLFTNHSETTLVFFKHT